MFSRNFFIRTLESRKLTLVLAICLIAVAFIRSNDNVVDTSFLSLGVQSDDPGGGAESLLRGSSSPTAENAGVEAPTASIEDTSPADENAVNSVGSSEDESTSTDQTRVEQSDAAKNNNTGSNMKVLIFVTAHVNDSQISFFQYCWPLLMKTCKLLNMADILVYAATDVKIAPENQMEKVLPSKNSKISFFKNPGYQQGAIVAMADAMKNNLFDPYDWVIRLNPDVLIRDDAFLLKSMEDHSIDGIFSRCPRPESPKDDGNYFYPIHTDFFAVRPQLLNKDVFDLPTDIPQDEIGSKFTAEIQAAAVFAPIIEAGRHVWLPNVRHDGKACRIVGKDSPVIHDHAMLAQCRDIQTVSGGSNGDHTLYDLPSCSKAQSVVKEACSIPTMKDFKGYATVDDIPYHIDCTDGKAKDMDCTDEKAKAV